MIRYTGCSGFMGAVRGLGRTQRGMCVMVGSKGFGE